MKHSISSVCVASLSEVCRVVLTVPATQSQVKDHFQRLTLSYLIVGVSPQCNVSQMLFFYEF